MRATAPVKKTLVMNLSATFSARTVFKCRTHGSNTGNARTAYLDGDAKTWPLCYPAGERSCYHHAIGSVLCWLFIQGNDLRIKLKVQGANGWKVVYVKPDLLAPNMALLRAYGISFIVVQ